MQFHVASCFKKELTEWCHCNCEISWRWWQWPGPIPAGQERPGFVPGAGHAGRGSARWVQAPRADRSCCIGCVMGCISWNAERWWRSSSFRYNHVQPMVWVLAFVSSLSIWPVSRADALRQTILVETASQVCPKQAAFVPLAPPIHPCFFFIYFPNRNH